MNINRNNYEEFLLLYIDGEISSNEEKEVEQFLELNADIKQEFENLLKTKLEYESISFGDVSTLYKTEDNNISTKNYQEYFLLFVDKELNNQQQQETETFVLQHPNLQQEFLSLQQTKLPLENITYPQKKDLYKKNKTPIVFYLKRIAVAAVFIGLIAFVWNINSTKTADEIATLLTVENTILPASQSTNKTVIDSTNTNNDIVASVVAENKIKQVIVAKNSIVPIQKNIVKTVTKSTPVSLNNQNNIQLVLEQNNKAINNIAAVNNQTQNNNDNSIINNNTTATLVNNNTVAVKTPIARQVIYKSLEADDDNKSTLAASEEIKTSKLNGLFKKAIKAITPKDSDDNDSKKLFAVTL
ncbi:MAG: anti-sigma factor family protein [Chitinophagaceae bacterium]